MRGLNRGELFDAARFAPLREAAHGIQVRLARVVVVDLGGEEFEEALGSFGCRREEPDRKRGGAGEGTSSVVMESG
jgi:hypothetical protein